MSDNFGGAQAVPPAQPVAHPPFPGVRVLYAIGFAFLAYFALHVLFVLALIQVVVLAINGRTNEELKHFSLNLIQYLWEVLAFITFARDERPFPLGPFPHQ